jgi:hypothetical protein
MDQKSDSFRYEDFWFAPPVSRPFLWDWLLLAGPGDRLRYYTGFLEYDCSPDRNWYYPVDFCKLYALAKLAAWAAEKGIVDLFQCPRGPDVYDYYIQMRDLPSAEKHELMAPSHPREEVFDLDDEIPF